jgi:hypothetical protein
MQASRRLAGLTVAAACVGLAAAAAAPAATRLQASLSDEPLRASAVGVSDGRLLATLRPRDRRLCFHLRVWRGKRPARAVIRGRTPKLGRVRLELFDRPGSAARRGCVRPRERSLLRVMALSPQSFSILVRKRAHGGQLRGRLGRTIGSFETHDLSQFDHWSVANGTLTTTREASYQGLWGAKASNFGGGNQYQRTWYDVDWHSGVHVWYGLALFIPGIYDWCWWTPVRWDNFKTFGSGGDVGGVRIQSGLLYVDRGTYSFQRALIGPVQVPEGRWTWVEVHQRLSGRAGKAVTELFIDGVRRGRSTAANTRGRPIDQIRYGNVAMSSSCSEASAIYFDRVSLSGAPRGPLPAGAHRARERVTPG